MTDVVEINDASELKSYHVAWTALHSETPGATFFNTLEWIEAFWRHFGEGRRLRVFVVRSEGRPIGFVPMCEVVEPTALGPRRVLTYPLDNWASAFGPVGPWPAAALTLAMRRVAETPRTWDVLEPRWTTHTTSDNGRTERAMRLAGMPGVPIEQATTSLVECGRFADWEDYLQSRTKKARHEIRRQSRQLERAGRVEHVVHRPAAFRHGDGDPRWDLFEACLAVSRKSWQARSTTGNTLCHARVSAFLRDAHEQAARVGMLDLHLLKVDDRPVAFFYGYHCHGRVVGVRTGYDPRAPKGAGAVLLGKVLESSFDRGDRVVDLGAGDEPYKARLRTTTESAMKISHGGFAAWRARAVATAVSLRQLRWRRPKEATA